jgi:hypothetical protein
MRWASRRRAHLSQLREALRLLGNALFDGYRRGSRRGPNERDAEPGGGQAPEQRLQQATSVDCIHESLL